ncbi:hypothetical protein QQY66_47475 [Streptomyces sp. DG2A-72]|uniref:hypothetical protein n=1 Tax=Streptomyces sp. DG2A-72 TaxID=3051386 RepID=UPI00265BC27F|nr:hypothetical protein [Streptomyces sp. DG2A-72]MDO0938990.1 hypothetical protein [Streptomyces sp. DG2A-72]
MHDVAEQLTSAEGGDAEDREITRQNMVELLAPSSEHRPPVAPLRLSGLVRRTPVSGARPKISASSYLITCCGAVALSAVMLLAGMPSVFAVLIGIVLFVVLQGAAPYVSDLQQLRLTTRAGRQRAAKVRAAAYRQYAATVTDIVQSVRTHWQLGSRLAVDERRALLEKLHTAPDVLDAHKNPVDRMKRPS